MNSISHIIDEINKTNTKFKQLIALNQKQAADVLGVSSSTLESWRKNGIGPTYKQVVNGSSGKGRILYSKTALAEWLANTIKTA